MLLLASAMRTDLIEEATWLTQISALAKNPVPVSPLRALDIVVWQAGKRQHVADEPDDIDEEPRPQPRVAAASKRHVSESPGSFVAGITRRAHHVEREGELPSHSPVRVASNPGDVTCSCRVDLSLRTRILKTMLDGHEPLGTRPRR